jgi:predicted AAA+ superfamily ATPase
MLASMTLLLTIGVSPHLQLKRSHDLVVTTLWPVGHSERKKARPMFYFFDCGVVRALHNRLIDPPSARERGHLFETWFVNELRRECDYRGLSLQLRYYRERDVEVDLVVCDSSGPRLGMEIKSGNARIYARAVSLFKRRFPGLPMVVASLDDTRPRREHDTEVLPWPQALDRALGV